MTNCTPNICAGTLPTGQPCRRTACSLFSAAPGEQATLCGTCAFPHLRNQREQDQALGAALNQISDQAEQIKRLHAELSDVTRRLRNAHQANADLYDYTGGYAQAS